MLKLTNIVKNYDVGDESVPALKGISIEFRKSEFVAILGPSGCGKTTLLNIIGGLDKYTSGDLSINGRSTKRFKDSDWDSYRNHSVGFVFQSYNLIPHQSVLANVELALTLSGVSKHERRKRAIEALKKVGLADQIKKKPNQMSGGQMQRVAIARALVNDPEILMADEPTGALDSQTSVQIMELLKEIAKDKLVIMVTHNPELADTYATRIVRCLDGEIQSDSNPYGGDASVDARISEVRKLGKSKKTSMSFFTALSLSLNNLMTKKGRTILTSFAGSIGIIGIALILAVSTGVQAYIDKVQEDTLSSYPITINAQEVDMTSMITNLQANASNASSGEVRELNAVYENRIMYDMMNSMSKLETQENNLVKFKEFIETSESLKEHVSAIQYSYDAEMNVYVTNSDGDIVESDIMELMASLYAELGVTTSSSTLSSYMQLKAWQELLPGMDGEIVNSLMTEQYDLVTGRWPENYDEIVIAVNSNNEINDMMLFALGLKTFDDIKADLTNASKGEEAEETEAMTWSYEDIMALDFRVILDSDKYQHSGNGYIDVSQTEAGLKYLYDSENAVRLKIVGIIRPNEDAVGAFMTGVVGYTSDLTNYLVDKAMQSEIIKEQLENPEIDVLNGLKFRAEGEEETQEEINLAVEEWLKAQTVQQRAAIYTELMSIPDDAYLSNAVAGYLATMTPEDIDAMLLQAVVAQTQMDEATVSGYIASMDEATKQEYTYEIVGAMVAQQYAEEIAVKFSNFTVEQLDAMLSGTPLTDAQNVYIFENHVPSTRSDSDLEKNLKLLGNVDKSSPKTIYIYSSTFESKDEISDIIADYNSESAEEDKISYTDYIKLLMSSITTIISAISYVLIAFVAISLVVSSIMIGIITYISVLERTKEIGILRAVGASKKDISRVFNAETLIVGFTSGVLGIGITVGLVFVVNIILHELTGIANLSAVLPMGAAIILVGISMFLTLIAGLIPSGVAAKKDPVVALRTE